MEILPKRSLRGVTPFAPEQPNEQIRRELGLKDIVRLCSNESSLGPSPRALAAYRQAADSLSCYPDGGSPGLRAALARHKRTSHHKSVHHVLVEELCQSRQRPLAPRFDLFGRVNPQMLE